MKIIAKNKRARFDYEILDTIEAGIVLSGPEIKSIREGKVNLKGSYVGTYITQGGASRPLELSVKQMHVTPYPMADTPQDPMRERKLLLHKKEVVRLSCALDEKGTAVIPLELYLKKGLAKLLLGIGKGKQLFDKRETLKRRAQNIEVARALKKY